MMVVGPVWSLGLEPYQLTLLEGSFEKSPDIQCRAPMPLFLGVNKEQKYLEQNGRTRERGWEQRSIQRVEVRDIEVTGDAGQSGNRGNSRG